MEKLKILKIALICISINCFIGNMLIAQEKPKDPTNFSVDIDKVKVRAVDNASVDVTINNNKFLDINFWKENVFSTVIIHLNDSVAEKLSFSTASLLESRSQLLLVNGEYVEDGRRYSFKDGSRISHFYTYRKGLLDGQFISYHYNGQVQCLGTFKNGNQFGVWKFYDRNGKLIRTKRW